MDRKLANTSVEILKTYPLRPDFSANLTSNVELALGWSPGTILKIFINRDDDSVILRRVKEPIQ